MVGVFEPDFNLAQCIECSDLSILTTYTEMRNRHEVVASVPPQVFALAIMQHAYEASEFGHKTDSALPCAPSGARAGDLWSRPRLYGNGTYSRDMHLHVIGNEAVGMYGMANRPKAAVDVIQEKLGCWNNATCHCVPDTNVQDWIAHIQSLAFILGCASATTSALMR